MPWAAIMVTHGVLGQQDMGGPVWAWYLGTYAATCLLLLASYRPLVSALVVIPSFFMLPNITAITIIINSQGSHIHFLPQGQGSRFQAAEPFTGDPGSPCLPGHWVRRAVVGVCVNWWSSRVEWGHLYCKECV